MGFALPPWQETALYGYLASNQPLHFWASISSYYDWTRRWCNPQSDSQADLVNDEQILQSFTVMSNLLHSYRMCKANAIVSHFSKLIWTSFSNYLPFINRGTAPMLMRCKLKPISYRNNSCMTVCVDSCGQVICVPLWQARHLRPIMLNTECTSSYNDLPNSSLPECLKNISIKPQNIWL